MTYAEWLESLLPPPIADRWGRGFARVVGGTLDDILPLVKDAAKAGLVADAPDDALAHHGRDRGLPQAPGESVAAHRARLVAAWETWRWASSARSIRDALLLAQLGGATIYPQRELPRPPRTTWWARFTLVFSGRATWGAHAWGDGWTWGGRVVAPVEALSDAELRAVARGVIRPWKAARDRVTSVIVARGAFLWGTDRWGSGWSWGSGAATEHGAPPWGSETWGSGWSWGYFL